MSPSETTSRRRLLAALAGLPVGLAAGLVATRAAAFRIEPLDRDAAEAYAAACGTPHPAYHQALVDDLVGALEAEGVTVGPDEIAQALKALSCPLCGCSMAEAPDTALPTR